MHPRFLARSLVVIALGLAGVGFTGLLVSSCGPQQKFCPDAGDGVCRPPPDAPVDMGIEAPPERDSSVFIGADSGTD
jgi:hypothetical protein